MNRLILLAILFIGVSPVFSNASMTIQTNPIEVKVYWHLTQIGISDKNGKLDIPEKYIKSMKKAGTEVELLFKKDGYFETRSSFSLLQPSHQKVKLVSLFDYFDLVEIPAGSFTMGSLDSEYKMWFEKPLHKVQITKPFYMGKFEVNQRQWKKILHRNLSHNKKDDLPAENISWLHVQKFLLKLNKIAGCKTPDTLKSIQKSGLHSVASGCYRLPTEAEWEYAARAGSKTAFHFGDIVSPKDANFDLNHPYAIAGKIAPKLTGMQKMVFDMKGLQSQVGGKFKPNSFELYDMHGNVSEWVVDWFDPKFYKKGDVIDPVNTKVSKQKVARGGGWNSWGRSLRSASRFNISPKYRGKATGFRLVLVK
ncbi:MAG: formylglycine-generating enzyme family protein [Candidatus Cloacimonetes bacterium]|nr:formylglycine-generating enzyme family protein [Candidatus Cloacimonadota bacterium]